MNKWFGFVAVSLWMTTLQILLATQTVAGEDTPEPAGITARRMRQPVALTITDGGKTLLVANHRSGSVSVVDATTQKVLAEYEVGRGLSDLASLSGGRYLLAVDQAANQVLLIESHDRAIRVVERTNVSPDPIRLVVSTDCSLAVVASRWSRRVTFIGLARGSISDHASAISILGTLDLPYSPCELALVDDGSKLIVGDAFGGKLAVVDTKRRAIDLIRSLPAHNIRGLAFAPDGRTLVVAHQVVNPLAHTSFDDVHWGLLIRNHLRVLRTSRLMPPYSDVDLLDGSQLFDLGDVGYGAGDPGDLAFDVQGNLIAALTGVDEVAITASPGQGPRRIVVGRRPAAVLPSPDGRLAFIADSLDDTISVVEVATGLRQSTIALGPRPEPTAADRGERLFSSAKLSHDGWMSCQSCHTDGHTNSLVSDTLGDGSYGAPKRIPSLLGVAATGPWTWTGSMVRLEDQIRKSIATTMHGTKPTNQQVTDLAAYLESLAPPSAEVTRTGPADASAVARGRELFEARKCVSCHLPPEYTSPGRYDVGLSDEVGHREFNPPSLRGVSGRDSLLHDGRAHSLEEVFQKELHPRGLELTGNEIADLMAFLRTL
jgi:YVTN family beta-propeller protein